MGALVMNRTRQPFGPGCFHNYRDGPEVMAARLR